MSSRLAKMQRSHSLFQKIANGGICVYCGVPATTIDHFVPISVVASISSLLNTKTARVLIPSCGECNCIASDKIFPTVGAKRRYVQKRLAAKYRLLTLSPDWTEDELDELEYVLQDFIRGQQRKKQWLLARLSWRNKHNAAAVQLVKVHLRLKHFGKSFARQNAKTTGT